MIEKQFNDPTGFTDKNTFFQFDQWETQKIHGAKNRFIYDFSFPIIPGNEDIGYMLPYTPILTNLSPAAGIYIAEYGRPGGLAEYVGPVTAERTINEDEATISVAGNTFMFLNKRASSAYGALELADAVDYFRSGYVEFTIKTNKNNCIIASGSSQVDAADLYAIFWTFGASMDYGTSITTLTSGDTMAPKSIASENYPYYRADSFEGALINLNIKLVDGKLAVEYYDDYNKDDVNFTFIGNENVADGEWHHVVINFGRPGLIKTHGTKYNKKFIDIWVDGSLDKTFDDKVNDYQIFYPTVKWLFNSPKDTVLNYLDTLNVETNFDYRTTAALDLNQYVGYNELLSDYDIFNNSVQTAEYAKNAFSGAIHTFAHGVNIPISQYEIKNRMRLWKKQTKKFAKTIDVKAEMISPAVSTDSKKALRLFWNSLVESSKFGVELDNTFNVETYSVTHELNNSSTEVLNNDTKLNKKDINILENVRVVLTEDILVNGPGMVFFANTEEAGTQGAASGISVSWLQTNPKSRGLDSVSDSNLSGFKRFVGPRTDITFSGLSLNSGDRILLTNQIKTEENGIWIFNGLDKYLSRPTDALISDYSKNNVVYVAEGYNAGTYWKLENKISSLLDPQKWSLVNLSNTENFYADFTLKSRWKTSQGTDRFININSDIDVNKYDLITFVNYPENSDQIFAEFPNMSRAEVAEIYSYFIESLKIAAANGAKLFVSSPKLAEDLGIVKKFEAIDQVLELSDAQSASINPFQINEDADRYFDTHRNNRYHLATEIPGLTDRETWLLTDFINYLPKNSYENEEYHAKYSYRQFGIAEGNEFFIPTLSLKKSSDNNSLPGYRQNARTIKPIYAVSPENILAGTIVTKFANTYYSGNNLVTNNFDDYATTIVIHNGQLLGDYPITGKIFVNCAEDSYTMSREEYNKATIQVIPQDATNETVSTRSWQYSTSRLDRAPRRSNISGTTSLGQVIPTLGGGGALIQSETNSSNGIINSESVRGNVDYESDLYPMASEEIYETQEIPVLSMTWLGLQWLAE